MSELPFKASASVGAVRDGPDSRHECSCEELACVYCGTELAPVNCAGCGRFVDAVQLNEGLYRCKDCE